VDSLLPLRTLTADIKQFVVELSDVEGGLGNSRCLDTRPEHVLVVGQVIGSRDPVNGVKVARMD